MSRTAISVLVRRRLAEQAHNRCGYCQTSEEITGIALVVDHLIPEALGGTSEEENLWLACGPCNLYKSDRIAARDPVTAAWIPLFDPRRQRWSDHFAWSPAGDEIAGHTPTATVTIQLLRLNRPLVVRARRAWVAAGWHPPHDE